MKQTETQESKVIEFYEHTTKIDASLCEHNFKRLSPTRVLCSRCGLGFFDDPFNPFPVEEVNTKTRKDKKEKRLAKDN